MPRPIVRLSFNSILDLHSVYPPRGQERVGHNPFNSILDLPIFTQSGDTNQEHSFNSILDLRYASSPQ